MLRGEFIELLPFFRILLRADLELISEKLHREVVRKRHGEATGHKQAEV